MSTGSSLRRLLFPSNLSAWKAFALAMGVLGMALVLALFSAAASQTGRFWTAAVSSVSALALAAWVAVAILPAMARRSSLRWLAYQVDYRLTREGLIYLLAVAILVLAAVNTGNNLLFLVLACLLAGILISGVLSRMVLYGIELEFSLPEHVFAGRPTLARMTLQNEKQGFPSFSLRVCGTAPPKGSPAMRPILAQPIYFPHIPRKSEMTQRVELQFPHRGIYRQEGLGLSTRFPFGFLEKTRRIHWGKEIVVYPRIEPTDATFELLPLLSGEMASFYRGRGYELHSLRDYNVTDSARYIDWKASAKTGALKVREFSCEDERRVMIAFDPWQPLMEPGSGGSDEPIFRERFERAVELAACIIWHFSGMQAVAQLQTPQAATPMAPAGEILFDALRELALIEPGAPGEGSSFLNSIATDGDIFKVVLTARPRGSIPTVLWTSSYILFFNSL